DQPGCGGYADFRHRPKVRDDFRNTPLPYRPSHLLRAALALKRLQQRAQRANQIEERRSLVPNFMDERRCDAAPDHALARNADDRYRTIATAGQTRARTANRSSVATREVTDHRPRLKG